MQSHITTSMELEQPFALGRERETKFAFDLAQLFPPLENLTESPSSRVFFAAATSCLPDSGRMLPPLALRCNLLTEIYGDVVRKTEGNKGTFSLCVWRAWCRERTRADAVKFTETGSTLETQRCRGEPVNQYMKTTWSYSLAGCKINNFSSSSSSSFKDSAAASFSGRKEYGRDRGLNLIKCLPIGWGLCASVCENARAGGKQKKKTPKNMWRLSNGSGKPSTTWVKIRMCILQSVCFSSSSRFVQLCSSSLGHKKNGTRSARFDEGRENSSAKWHATRLKQTSNIVS